MRTQPRRQNEVGEILLEMAESAIRNREVQGARVFSHHLAPGGFTLTLFWETATIPAHGSETAMLILEGLRPFGLLDHMVLILRGESKRTKRAQSPKKSGDDTSIPSPDNHPVEG